MYTSSHNSQPTPVPARAGRDCADTACAEVKLPTSPPNSTSLSARITVPATVPTRSTAALYSTLLPADGIGMAPGSVRSSVRPAVVGTAVVDAAGIPAAARNRAYGKPATAVIDALLIGTSVAAAIAATS